MSDPRWRDVRPSRPYGGDPGDTPRGRDTRGLDPRLRAGNGRGPADEAATRRTPAQAGLTQPIAPQPTFTPRPAETPRRAASEPADRPGKRHGRRTANRPRAAGGRLSRIWEGSLRGSLGVCVIVGSAVIGTVATIVTKAQPGSVLGLFVLAGTVAAALTVQPRTGRLIFPVPALSYLIAALAAGVVYDRAADKTQIAVGAAQWIASGFFVMVLSTLLAVALTTVRWYMWRRDQRGPATGQPRRPGRRRARPAGRERRREHHGERSRPSGRRERRGTGISVSGRARTSVPAGRPASSPAPGPTISPGARSAAPGA